MAAAAALLPPPTPASQLHPSVKSPPLKAEEALRAAAMTATQRTTGINTPISASFPPTSAYPSSLQSPRLDTPMSASFRSNSSGSKAGTPLTPPNAYMEFLKALTPTFQSPMSTGNSSHFTFTAGPASARFGPPGSAALDAKENRFSLPAAPNSARPALPSQHSSSSISSNGSNKSRKNSAGSNKIATELPTTKENEEALASPSYPYPQGPSRQNSFSSIPPSPRHPDRPSRRPSIRIPDSPSAASPTLVKSPASVRSPTSSKPHVQSPLSAVPYSAGGKTSPVSIRHVVTRTVMYSSSPIGPLPQGIDSRLARHSGQPLVGEAPKGKRRKVERE